MKQDENMDKIIKILNNEDKKNFILMIFWIIFIFNV